MTDYFQGWWFATTQFQTVSLGHLIKKPSSVGFSLSASIPAVLAKAGKMQTCWLNAILYWHKECFFLLSRRQKFKQSRIWSSLFGVHCKCVFDLKGINYSNHRLLVMSFPVSTWKWTTRLHYEYILNLSYNLSTVWCLGLLSTVVCVCFCKEQRSKDHLLPDVSFRHVPPGMHNEDKTLCPPCEKRQTYLYHR